MPYLPFYYNDQARVSSSDSRIAQCWRKYLDVSLFGSHPAYAERNRRAFTRNLISSTTIFKWLWITLSNTEFLWWYCEPSYRRSRPRQKSTQWTASSAVWRLVWQRKLLTFFFFTSLLDQTISWKHYVKITQKRFKIVRKLQLTTDRKLGWLYVALS